MGRAEDGSATKTTKASSSTGDCAKLEGSGRSGATLSGIGIGGASVATGLILKVFIIVHCCTAIGFRLLLPCPVCIFSSTPGSFGSYDDRRADEMVEALALEAIEAL